MNAFAKLARSIRKSLTFQPQLPIRRGRLQLEPLEARDVPSGSPVRTYDGTGNNLTNTDWGSTGSDLIRVAAAAYADGLSAPAGADRPSPRVISNALADEHGVSRVSAQGLSAMVYAWGQFLDHDIGLTPTGSTETLSIPVPTGDPSFDPNSTGTKTITTKRSIFDAATGTSTAREQVNTITAWIDGSMVYGSNDTTAAALRTFSGGQLKTSAGNLLPFNDAATFPTGTVTMSNDAHVVANDQLFAAGDARANENIELTSIQTLFVREHNRVAAELAAANPNLTDGELYQRARAIVVGEIQAITYNEWLPTLLGPDALAPYAGYDDTVNPQLANEFSTAAFRFGHSLLADDIQFLNNSGTEVRSGVSLSAAFFNPATIRDVGVDPILKYLASDPSSEIDTKVVDSVRNFLFGPPGSGGLDLASLNIERGRDHGLADYNSAREAYGLPRVTTFAMITSNAETQAKLQELYGSVDKIDLWVGGLAEDHLPGSSVGPTLKAIITEQFERLRDGDRFWYQNTFTGAQLRELDNTTLADVIARNSTSTNLQENVFRFRVGVSGSVTNFVNRPVAGHRVELVTAGGESVAAATTDTLGQYAFAVVDGLRTGDYAIQTTDARGARVTRSVSVSRGDLFQNVDLALADAPADPVRVHCYAVGENGGGRVQAYHADGTPSFTLTPYEGFLGGVHVATGDVNGDGVDDIVTGAAAGAAPHVKVFDGLTGQEIASFFAYDREFLGGVNVAIGDIDGDGFAEIVTGAGPGAAPHVKVFDGRDFAERQSYFAYDEAFLGGVTVAVGVEPDGRAIIVTGTETNGSHVKVFDGRGSLELRSFLAFDAKFVGGVSVAASDLNGDGVADVVIGAGAGGGSRVEIVGGRDGRELASFIAFSEDYAGATGVSRIGLGRILARASDGDSTHLKAFGLPDGVEVWSYYAFE